MAAVSLMLCIRENARSTEEGPVFIMKICIVALSITEGRHRSQISLDLTHRSKRSHGLLCSIVRLEHFHSHKSKTLNEE